MAQNGTQHVEMESKNKAKPEGTTDNNEIKTTQPGEYDVITSYKTDVRDCLFKLRNLIN